jgi:hypothetical protein
MKTKERIAEAFKQFEQLSDIPDTMEGIEPTVKAMDAMRDIINLLMERNQELEEQLQMYKRV